MTHEKSYRKAAQSLRPKREITPEKEYVLVKADGSRSGRNCYSAISRLQGHYPGSRIEAVA